PFELRAPATADPIQPTGNTVDQMNSRIRTVSLIPRFSAVDVVHTVPETVSTVSRHQSKLLKQLEPSRSSTTPLKRGVNESGKGGVSASGNRRVNESKNSDVHPVRHIQSIAFGLLLWLALAVPVCAQSLTSGQLSAITFEQKLGAQVPLSLAFRDETGRSVKLADYFDQKPVVLVLGYYECPM